MRLSLGRVRIRLWVAVATSVLTLAIAFLAVVAALGVATTSSPVGATSPMKTAAAKLGLQLNHPEAFQGYTLVAPLNSTKSYLIDMQGRVVRTWKSQYMAGQDAYLLENGHLLRAARLNPREQTFSGAGQGGRVQEFDWDGNIVWNFKFHDDTRIAHHDICPLPNGHVLLIVWEIETRAEALAAGRERGKMRTHWLADSLVEVKPTGKTAGEVVWEWHAWDHLIQDFDPSKANYGDVSKHPELIDVNFGDGDSGMPAGDSAGPPSGEFAKNDVPNEDEARKSRELDRLRGLGYVGTAAARRNQGFIPDWTHVNAVAYNAELDQIMITVRSFGEFWIIDHSTTIAQAASHSGGRHGKGGDLLYRWGNPRSYRAGTKADQRLFAQHDAHWIHKGYPGAGHVLVFNNGCGRPGLNYSSVDEIVLPVDPHGDYTRNPGKPFGPSEPAWSYSAPKKDWFFADIMSGANRLPNGNTLICDSTSCTIFEVTPAGKTVWKYANPDGGGFGPPDAPGGPPTGVSDLFGRAVFRAYRYAKDYPGLAGRLAP